MTKNLMAIGLAALSLNAFSAVNTFFYPSLDVNALHEKELAREVKGEAPHFAVPRMVSINPMESSNWEEINGMMIWKARFNAPNAVSLNFGFSEFNLSPNASVSFYSSDLKNVIRDFTSSDNNEARELWTPVIMGDDVTLEIKVPRSEFAQVSLKLSSVNQAFRTFSQKTAKSGSCNVDVACKESTGWEKEVNAVAVISTGGSTMCTGFMVNNTSNDKTPYFMTAAHCGISARNAATLVTYWNYQASSCGGSRDGRQTQFNTGSTFLAGSTKSDFTLVKLNKEPSREFGVTYAGWDRSGTDASQAVAIHHPNTDEKSISFENEPTTVTDYLGEAIPGDGTHVRIEDWDVGTTEPGSSGSPLFNQDHRVIGQLHGGWASCESQTADYYGRLHTSWSGEGRKGTRLSDFLDARNSGESAVDSL